MHPTSVVARQEGIEPPTHSLEGCCSIRLSYWRFSHNGAASYAVDAATHR